MREEGKKKKKCQMLNAQNGWERVQREEEEEPKERRSRMNVLKESKEGGYQMSRNRRIEAEYIETKGTNKQETERTECEY